MASPTTTPRAARLIKVAAAAAEYGHKYTTLRDIAHRGELPVIRVGRAWYFERRDVEAWIEANKQRAATW
jgi:excisionase family DNA binding protein